jgi:hypothetical protein
MKRIIFFTTIFVLVLATAFAINMPPDLLKFYNSPIGELTLSESSIILYDVDSIQFFIGVVNPTEIEKQMTLSINCVSLRCPTSSEITLDYLQNDSMQPFAKKVIGLFIYTNQTPLGTYDYTVTYDDGTIQTQNFQLEVISESLWIQFWYNLKALVGFK